MSTLAGKIKSKLGNQHSSSSPEIDVKHEKRHLTLSETSSWVIMPSTSKELREHIGFGLCIRASVHVLVRLSKTVHAKVLKFHGKIVDRHFFFLSELSPFLELCPFENIRMKSPACHILQPCMLGF